MKKIILSAILLVFILPPLLKAEGVTLTLDEAVVIALRENRDILLKVEDFKKAKEKIAEAESGLFPTFSFTGGWKDTRDYYAKKDLGQTFTQFSLKQYLYQGGKTINTLKQYRDKLEVSEALLDKAKLELAYSVEKTFYLLLLSSELADLNQKILDNTLEHYVFVEARFRSGQASESELLKIRQALSSVEEAYLNSANQVKAAEALLKNLLYLEQQIEIKAKGAFSCEVKELAYDEAILKAMKDRPEIRQYATQEKADKKAIEIAKADNRPSIYASWDYYTSSTSLATFSPGRAWNDYNVIGFTFSWPIFDGWATKAKVEQAVIDLKATQLTREKTVRDIALELKDAYLALKDAIAKIRSAGAGVALYQDNLLTAESQAQKGIASDLDISDAKLKYEISLFGTKEAIYDYIIARYAFDKATGG